MKKKKHRAEFITLLGVLLYVRTLFRERISSSDYTLMVEARRIELLSENRSAQLSPGAVRRFLFPEEAAPDAAFLSVSL